jgi:hypothetical protein
LRRELGRILDPLGIYPAKVKAQLLKSAMLLELANNPAMMGHPGVVVLASRSIIRVIEKLSRLVPALSVFTDYADAYGEPCSDLSFKPGAYSANRPLQPVR